MSFSDPELDVLLYILSYKSAYGVPPSAEEVRQAVEDPDAVDQLDRQGYLITENAHLMPEEQRILLSLLHEIP